LEREGDDSFEDGVLDVMLLGCILVLDSTLEDSEPLLATREVDDPSEVGNMLDAVALPSSLPACLLKVKLFIS